MTTAEFPIDLKKYKPIKISLQQVSLTSEQKEQLRHNIYLARDAIVFFTAYSNIRGYGGHTGGAYDIVPEIMIAESFVNANPSIYPTLFDEAGHRVAIHYLMSVLRGHMPVSSLLRYREHKGKLPGHPERDFTPGIEFSSGRLGHMWAHVNGVALSKPSKKVIMFGSDGSLQEGNDAESARFAVAQDLDVKIFIDNNNVTITGHPTDYLKGFDIKKTLQGHNMAVKVCDAENIDDLFNSMREAFLFKGPFALICNRKMAPGIKGIEDTAKGHDAIDSISAIDYLKEKGQKEAVSLLQNTKGYEHKKTYKGSSLERYRPRDEFGKIICDILQDIPEKKRKENVIVIDSDLGGSCGLHHIQKRFPEIYIQGGIMERANFSAAAGFGSEKGKQGIFGTFSAFLEMLISEITMARMNHANVLAHFSHAGIDHMADNACHFGINNFFAANAIAQDDITRLYFPADHHQMRAILDKVFNDSGLRFIFSSRSPVPNILDDKDKILYSSDYKFIPGKDEIIRKGSKGFVVSYGEMLYRSLDAVEKAKEQGIDVGLINKPTLNIIDEDTMQLIGKTDFVIVVESQNRSTGLGSIFGSWLLERGYTPRYTYLGVTKKGEAGLHEQVIHQELDSESILRTIKKIS